MAEIATQVLPLQKAPFRPANQKSKAIPPTPMAEMPTPAGVASSDDYATGLGISRTLADAVRTEILERTVKQATGGTSKETDTTRSNTPITFVTHGNYTRTASNAYLTEGDKTAIARVLKVPVSEVLKRFKGSEPGICNNLESELSRKSIRTDWVYSIIACGDLSFENGLPALGDSKTKFILQSGEVLHFLGDMPQTYSGTGGGALIWLYWNNLPV